MKKKHSVPEDEELSSEDIAATFELQKRPKVVLDRMTLERHIAAWHSEWQTAGLVQMQSSEDIFHRPKRVIRLSQEEAY